MIAAAYLRVSTEEQVNEGVSLASQEARVRAYCTMRGLDLAHLIIDAGVSAGKPLGTRPGGSKLVKLVRSKKVQAVIGVKLDRLFRDCADCLLTVQAWEKGNVALHLLDLGGQAIDTSSAMGKFFITLMAGAAELERNQIRERTSVAMQHLKATGKYTGGAVLYGYAAGPDGLIEVEAEQEILKFVWQLRVKGNSVRGIVGILGTQQKYSRTGRAFGFEQVRQMVKRG